MAHCGCDEDPQVLTGHEVPQPTQVDHPVHHLGHAETVAEVVERVVTVVLLHTQLKRRKEGNVLFNDALNTFYLRLYGVGHMEIS